MIDFQTSPDRYRHWRLEFGGDRADLIMDVDEAGGLFEGYELKLNSYDLGVDIELYDAIQRLRFEHPEVKTVVLRSAKERTFCAGANIRMLAGADHGHKVNFCKFTNETRLAMEDASQSSGQAYLAAVNGACAGGGYELALAAEEILLADDGSSSVALPEAPLLAVLPGTGGLTRLTDKRRVRRDRADIFCTTEEGIKGRRAVEWRLVDQVAPASRFEQAVADRADALSAASDRPGDAKGVALTPLERSISGDRLDYGSLSIEIDRAGRRAELTIKGPTAPVPKTAAEAAAQGAGFWPLRLARELEDAILHLRFNEPELGLLVFRSEGDCEAVLAYDRLLAHSAEDWLIREVGLFWKRLLKRIDVTSRSLVALVEPGSCFAGVLAEVVFACDRSYMLDGTREGDNRPPAGLVLSAASFAPCPMANGLSRLATRFIGEPESLVQAQSAIGETLEADDAERLGVITAAYDDIDWDDEIRILFEERASFSPDAMVGLEANLRFAGPETMETKIFGRLSAWQNWIFQRPNAVGAEGALRRYGSGERPAYRFGRV